MHTRVARYHPLRNTNMCGWYKITNHMRAVERSESKCDDRVLGTCLRPSYKRRGVRIYVHWQYCVEDDCFGQYILRCQLQKHSVRLGIAILAPFSATHHPPPTLHYRISPHRSKGWTSRETCQHCVIIPSCKIPVAGVCLFTSAHTTSPTTGQHHRSNIQ